MKDLTVSLEDRPGTLADLGEALGKAGINIEGMCAVAGEGRSIIHLLVTDANAARLVTFTNWGKTVRRNLRLVRSQWPPRPQLQRADINDLQVRINREIALTKHPLELVFPSLPLNRRQKFAILIERAELINP